MKTLIAAILLFAVPAMAQDFSAVTKDSEVADVSMVQVKVTSTVEQAEVYTLSYIDTQLAVKRAQADRLVNEIVALEMLKSQVETEAVKVVLKVDEPK